MNPTDASSGIWKYTFEYNQTTPANTEWLDYTNYSILGPAVIGIISMIPMAIYAIIILVLGQKKKSE